MYILLKDVSWPSNNWFHMSDAQYILCGCKHIYIKLAFVYKMFTQGGYSFSVKM
jgi:hypothetical protein